MVNSAEDAKLSATRPLQSILKQRPKYSSSPREDGGTATATASSESQSSLPLETFASASSTTAEPPIIVQQGVVERPRRSRPRVKPPPKRSPPPSTSSGLAATAVEGYTPRSNSNVPSPLQQQTPDVASQKTAAVPMTSSSPSPMGSKTDPMEGETKTPPAATFIKPSSSSTSSRTFSGAADNTNAASTPLVVNSLADLMQEAGTLPSQDSAEAPQVVEAQLEFSVADPTEWARQQQDKGEEEPTSRTEAETDEEEEENTSESDNDGEDAWDDDDDDVLGVQLSDDEDEPRQQPQPRAFMQLWSILSEYITPEAVTYVRQLREAKNVQEQDTAVEEGKTENHTPAEVQSDLEASRCAGLWALLQMHIGPCFVDELGRPAEQQRRAEQGLWHLLQRFSYKRAVEWDSRLARALTCVLLETLLFDERRNTTSSTKNTIAHEDSSMPLQVPPSCKVLNMTPEEYRYLTRSAIVNFGTDE